LLDNTLNELSVLFLNSEYIKFEEIYSSFEKDLVQILGNVVNKYKENHQCTKEELFYKLSNLKLFKQGLSNKTLLKFYKEIYNIIIKKLIICDDSFNIKILEKYIISRYSYNDKLNAHNSKHEDLPVLQAKLYIWINKKIERQRYINKDVILEIKRITNIVDIDVDGFNEKLLLYYSFN